MTRIRIHPDEVRRSGRAAVTCGDDLGDAVRLLQAMPLPSMPAAMAARHQAALASVQTRLGALSHEYWGAGEELQVRAAAAEAADAPSDARADQAGRQLERTVVSTAAIVAAGRTTGAVQLRSTGTRVVAEASSGLRLTIPDALERGTDAPVREQARAAADPHRSAHDRPATPREVGAHQPIGGAPAAALQIAAMLPAGARARGAAAAHARLGSPIAPGVLVPGRHRAEQSDDRDPLTPVDMPAADEADGQQWACWMASSAAQNGLPPALPVMMALAHSGLRNLPGASGDVGFFGLDPRAATAPAGFGLGPGTQPPGEWWAQHPDAQLDDVMTRLTGVGGGIRTGDLDDPQALERWAAEAAPHIDAAQFTDAQGAADALVGNCRAANANAGGAAAAGSALAVAQGQLGTHEAGVNAGPQVDAYLASAGVSSGNPWCASFVTWSLQESGHELPGTGWAAVSHWVQAAQAEQHGLQLVDAASARPGDIVAYDWGGESDFGGDGHIGFLESAVQDGQFTTVEGNANDAVTRMQRNLDTGNVVFIRLAA